MSKTLTEQKVLKKLKIEDFRHLTKDKVVTMVSMLDKMDPEVAKKAIEQFPEFSNTMKDVFVEFKKTLDKGLDENKESVKSIYISCDEIIKSCQMLLEKEEHSFEERKEILDYMMRVVELKRQIDSENKKFIEKIATIAGGTIVVVSVALITALGANSKIDTKDI